MFLNVKFNNNDDVATRWLSIMIYVCTYKCVLYDDFYFVMMRCHKDTVMLRSTTGSYGRPVIEVAYGEIIIHSTETVVVGV